MIRVSVNPFFSFFYFCNNVKTDEEFWGERGSALSYVTKK